MIDTKKKITFKTNKIEKLLDEIKKPMSLNEIEAKFGVSYPYNVKCVKELYSEGSGTSMNVKGKTITFDYDDRDDYARSFELDFFVYKNSKKFILWE